MVKNKICLYCKKNISKIKKYCDNKCQKDYQRKIYIEKWQAGEEDGIKGSGKHTYTSSHIKRYMKEKYGDKCARCDFSTRHPDDGKSIIELEHIDGNALNNLEENLILLCPNCHALTSTYRGRNRGKGTRSSNIKKET